MIASNPGPGLAAAPTAVRRALPAGDYGIVLDGRLVAAVERTSLPDLVSSPTNGKLGYQLAYRWGSVRPAAWPRSGLPLTAHARR